MMVKWIIVLWFIDYQGMVSDGPDVDVVLGIWKVVMSIRVLANQLFRKK